MSVKSRRGSMLMVLLCGATLTAVMVGFMQIAANLYTTSKESARMYANYQSYRAAIEIAAYQYIKDLCSVSVTKDLEGEWIGISGSALYLYSLDEIKAKVSDTDAPSRWQVRDIQVALSAVEMEEPAVLGSLMADLEHWNSEFWLDNPHELRLDWSDSGSWTGREGSYVALKPFDVDVHLKIRGENLNTTLTISNLYFDLQRMDMSVGSGEHECAVFSIVEGNGGVKIARKEI